ncbi:MAG: ATP-binding protein [Streptosporangiaceae bacterium]
MKEYIPADGPAGAGQAAAAFSPVDGNPPPVLDVTFTSGTLHALRAEVRAQARRAGFRDSRLAEMVLALHELAANAVRHGAGAGRLRIWNLTGGWHCQVDDGPPGSGDTPWLGTSIRAVISSLKTVPGHGLSVVRQVADRMQILSGPHGTSAVVTFGGP